jgi:DHA3 family macrolide efflux protein-like MFS transporter
MKSPYRNLFRNRNFAALWVGQTISFLGDYFYLLAIPIMINKLTGSALMVGLSVISSAVPMLLLGPLAGVFVDRWNRKTTMIVSDMLRGLLVLPCLLVKTPDQVWVYYLVGFLMSCVSRFFFPAQNAVLPLIVEGSNDLLTANGLMQAVMTVGMLAGPALAGFTIGLWGSWVAFVFDSLSYMASAAAILTMTIPHRRYEPRAGVNPVRSVLDEMRDGVAFMFKNPILTPMVIGMMIAFLSTGAITVIWVPYLQRTFGIGAEGLGIVDSAQGVGMLLGGLATGFLAVRFKKIPLAVLCLTFLGLCFIGVGVAPAFSVIIVISVGMGFWMVPVESVVMTIMQIVVPDEKRGRVGSAVNAMGTATSLLAMSAASIFGDMIGLANIYILCGFINVAAALLTLVIGREPEVAPAAVT